MPTQPPPRSVIRGLVLGTAGGGIPRAVLRRLFAAVMHAAGIVHRRQRVDVSDAGTVKVNVACGLEVVDGWIQVEGSLNALIARLPGAVHTAAHALTDSANTRSAEHYRRALRTGRWVHHELRNGLPFHDDTADHVYCSHFLEHLAPDDGAAFLRECRRVLKPGGVLRVVVPDLEVAWQMYERGEKERMLHDFFFTGGDAYSNHKHAYDFELLRDALLAAGFPSVERLGYREGATPDLDRLDNRADYSLYVEASV